MDDNVNDEIEADGPANSRRDLLKKAAVGGAVVWAAPTVLAGRAAAAQPSPPLPPNPPSCTFPQLAPNWNSITFTPPQTVKRFTGPIGSTGFTGNNADVVLGTYFITPTWIAPNNWVDVVGLGFAGSISAQFTVPCSGTYELRFRYSRYPGSGASTISANVNGHFNGPFNSPVSTSPATFTQQYSLTAGTVVNLVISGTAVSNSQGPALADLTFTLLTPP